jgi:hypothetical protein
VQQCCTHSEVTWGEEVIVYTNLRYSAVVCLLSSSLLVASSGWVMAAADSGASGEDAPGHEASSAVSAGASAGAEGPTAETTHGWVAHRRALSTAAQPSATETKAPHPGSGDAESAVATTQSNPVTSDTTSAASDSTQATAARNESESAPELPAFSTDPAPTSSTTPRAMETAATVLDAPPRLRIRSHP